MQILKLLGAFLQDCIQTNTPREIINCAWNIYYDYKRYRSLACLLISLALGAGGAALFVVQPNICGYFQSIILQGLPFIGSTVAKVVVGIVGFWIGGGVGFNSGKYISRQISEMTLGHSNTAYTFDDNDLQRIIKNNPQIYQYTPDIESGLTALTTTEDVQQLRALLEHVRSEIDNNSKSNPILHDRYKNALLQALRMSNLYPLLETLGSNSFSQEIRKNATIQAAQYIGDLPAQFFPTPSTQNKSKAKDDFQVKVKSSDNDSENEEDVVIPVGLKKNTVVFSNLKRVTKELNQQKTYPSTESTSNKGGKPLNDTKKQVLLYDLKRAHKSQHNTQQTEIDLIPDKFKPLLGIR